MVSYYRSLYGLFYGGVAIKSPQLDTKPAINGDIKKSLVINKDTSYNGKC